MNVIVNLTVREFIHHGGTAEGRRLAHYYHRARKRRLIFVLYLFIFLLHSFILVLSCKEELVLVQLQNPIGAFSSSAQACNCIGQSQRVCITCLGNVNGKVGGINLDKC